MRSSQGARLKNSHHTSTTSTEEDAAEDRDHHVPVDDERTMSQSSD